KLSELPVLPSLVWYGWEKETWKNLPVFPVRSQIAASTLSLVMRCTGRAARLPFCPFVRGFIVRFLIWPRSRCSEPPPAVHVRPCLPEVPVAGGNSFSEREGIDPGTKVRVTEPIPSLPEKRWCGSGDGSAVRAVGRVTARQR